MRHQHLSQTKKAIAPPQPENAIARSSTHPIEELQGAIGNQAVNKLLANQPIVQAKPMFRGLSHELVIQPKLAIGAVGDKYEQEADLIAEQVVDLIHAPQSPEIQREEMPEDDEELSPSPTIQRLAIQRRGETISGGEASADLESAIASARGGGQPLDPGLQAQMRQAMGADFSGVRVHTDAQSDRLNQSIQAKAFTTGQDIFFRQGTYQPGSREGQELIAHELTHVVQQTKRAETEGARGVERSERKIGAALVQRKIDATRLNVIGEQHNLSDARRPGEKRFCINETKGKGGYWKEHEFAKEASQFFVKEKNLAKGDPTRLRIAYLLINLEPYIEGKGIENYQDSLLLHHKKGSSLHIDEDRKKFNNAKNDALNLIQEAKDLKISEERKTLSKASQNALEQLLRIQDKVLSTWESAFTLTEFPKFVEDIDKNFIAQFERDNKELCQYASEITDKKFESKGDIVEARSEQMHKTANARAKVIGMWKVGDQHRKDIEKYHSDPESRKYNLVSMKEFDSWYSAWYTVAKVWVPNPRERGALLPP